MPFKINGVEIPTPNPDHGWQVERKLLGRDGNNHPIYAAPRTYTLSWDYLTTDEFNLIAAFYASIAASGTVTVDLPRWPGGVDYDTFTTYSNCTLDEPTTGGYFQRQFKDVQMLVQNIGVSAT